LQHEELSVITHEHLEWVLAHERILKYKHFKHYALSCLVDTLALPDTFDDIEAFANRVCEFFDRCNCAKYQSDALFSYVVSSWGCMHTIRHCPICGVIKDFEGYWNE
jgi:hypothetical protein